MPEQSGSNQSQNQTAGAAVWNALKSYLTDWRNLLGHALLGVVFVVAAVWAPVNIWIKLAVIACLIAFNVIRMRNRSKKNAEKEAASNELVS